MMMYVTVSAARVCGLKRGRAVARVAGMWVLGVAHAGEGERGRSVLRICWQAAAWLFERWLDLGDSSIGLCSEGMVGVIAFWRVEYRLQ